MVVKHPGRVLVVPAKDPLAPSNDSERALIEKLSQLPRDLILRELKDDLQTAIWIELATIPIYLFANYSIKRTERTGQDVRPIDLYANMAGSTIMSVVVEEMLHLALACNMLYAFGEDPQLYLHSPSPFPTPLAYHNPKGPPGPDGEDKVLIPLAKLSYEQLWHFLQIEYPAAENAPPEDRNWDTIGQFYSYIRCLIKSPQIRDSDFQVRGADAREFQIQPYNYSPNSIDTAYPKTAFDPWGLPNDTSPTTEHDRGGPIPASKAAVFSNAPDGHQESMPLLTIGSRVDALRAIETICDQGEGFAHERFDDDSEAEESHYYKFLTLQAQLEEYTRHTEHLPPLPEPPDPITPTITERDLEQVVANFPDNPTAIDYLSTYEDDPAGRVNYRPLADFCSGVYQYMLILTESIFKVRNTGADAASGQKLFFNRAMHRTMLWVLDGLATTMRGYELGDGHVLAPTFENVDLGSRSAAYANLMALAGALEEQPYADNIRYYVDLLKDVPDVSDLWGNADASVAQDEIAQDHGDSASRDEPTPGEPTPQPYPYSDVPRWPEKVGTQPPGHPLHACLGLNSCKGADRYGLEGHEDPLRPGVFTINDCAGQGYCSTTSDHNCHVLNDCRNQGGCGLYGTGDEMNRPARNECRGMGSCATPINAERFSTNGPNQGKSVWVRARQVFEEAWPETWQSVKGAPEHLGPAPAPFTDTGPPYLWISDGNTARDHMVACGSSGLSGAGGCS